MIKLEDLLINQNCTIKDALVAINKGAVEIALVVDENKRLLATVTDGDIRRALIKGAKLDEKIEKYMNRNFISVKADVKRAEVLDLMRAMTIKQIPILDNDGKILGLHLLREIIGFPEKQNIALIMAGGKGERLKPLTENIPKPMVKVAGRPILERLILHLLSYGIKNIYLSINYLSQVIENHFLDGKQLGCKINYLKEKKPLGTAGSLSLLKEIPKEPILVLNGDLLTQFNVDEMLDYHKKNNFYITVGVYDYVYKVPYGVVEEKKGKLISVKEKPSFVWSINAGIYVLNPQAIKKVPRNKVYMMTDLIEKCLEKKLKVGVYHIEGDWIDIGLHKDLKKAKGEI